MLDLTLLPFEPKADFSHDILRCERNSSNDGLLYDQILDLEKEWGSPVPERFNTYLSRLESDESGYGNTQETPYGKQLRWVLVERLLRVWGKEKMVSPKNRAIRAFLEELPRGYKVALFWR